MHPPRDGLSSRMVVDLIVHLDPLRQFVINRGLLGCTNNWTEVVRMYADERSFLDFSARRVHGSSPRILVEFGVHDDIDRRVVGFVDAQWDVVKGDFLRIESIVLEGELVDIDVLAERMACYLTLPVLTMDMVALADVA